MKRIISTLAGVCLWSGLALAGTIDGAGTYTGSTSSVAPGFFTGIGVVLTDGATCNGQPVVLLPYSDEHYKDMLATLLTAQASGQDVQLWRLNDVISTFPGGHSYCTVRAVSIGRFPLW